MAAERDVRACLAVCPTQMLLDLAIGLFNAGTASLEQGDFKEGRRWCLGMPKHGVLLIGTEVRNEVFRPVFRQQGGVWRDHNEPERLERPKGAALEFRHPFDLLMPISIRAEERLPCFWRCAQRQFLYAPRLVCRVDSSGRRNSSMNDV